MYVTDIRPSPGVVFRFLFTIAVTLSTVSFDYFRYTHTIIIFICLLAFSVISFIAFDRSLTTVYNAGVDGHQFVQSAVGALVSWLPECSLNQWPAVAVFLVGLGVIETKTILPPCEFVRVMECYPILSPLRAISFFIIPHVLIRLFFQSE